MLLSSKDDTQIELSGGIMSVFLCFHDRGQASLDGTRWGVAVIIGALLALAVFKRESNLLPGQMSLLECKQRTRGPQIQR